MEKFVPRKDVIIEGNTAKYQIGMNGTINGLYTGEFVFRCVLTPTQQIAANREYREMLGQNPTLAEERVSFMAYAISECKQRVISAPPFWTGTNSGVPGDVDDIEVLTAVLEAAVHAQLKYKHELTERKLELLKRATAAAEKIVNGQADKEDEDDLDLDEDEE